MKVLIALLLALLLPTAASAQSLTEARKIEMLIDNIQHLPGAVFIRNGSEHDSQAAADHLRDKWKYAGKRIKTAAQFIDGVATKSSMTGTKYTIRFADGRTVESGAYLHAQLRLIEARAAGAARSPAASPVTQLAPTKVH